MSRRTIQSPGVEIREIDLTQRPAEPVGTSVFIPGFSNQGPTDEILNVGTFADFEDIYGKPTNAAERYFYHSVRQTFNSDANVYVSRLPYGASDGTTTTKYTALVYPVVSPAVRSFDFNHNAGHFYLDFGAPNGLIDTGFEDSDIDQDGCQLYYEITTKKESTGLISYTTGSVTGLSAAIASSDGSILSGLSGASLSNLATSFSAISADTIIKAVAWSSNTTHLSGQIGTGGQKNVLGNNSLSGNDYYIFGNPTLVELTPSQYRKLESGEFNWDTGTAGQSAASYTGGSIVENASAGMIILNTARSSINNSFEGYYAGLIDGVNLNPATDFDGAVKQYAPTSTGDKGPGAFATIPTSRLDYTLSAASTSNARSISRTLEEIPRFNIQGAEFIDTLAFGLFKVRITPFSNDSMNLSYFLAEGYTGSLNSYRKVQNENGGERKSFFLEEQDDNSANVKILINPHISRYSGDWTGSGGAPTKFVRTNKTSNNASAAIASGFYTKYSSATNLTNDQGLFGFGAYTDTKNTSKDLGNIPAKLDRIFNIASNVDEFNIDVSIEAGLGTVWATIDQPNATSYDDTSYMNLGNPTLYTGFYTINENFTDENNAGARRDSYRTIFNRFEQFARETRKDHIFIADPLKHIFVQGENSKILDKKSNNFSAHVYWPLRHQFGFANSNYATVYGNWIKVYDATSDKQVWVPFSGNAAGIYARNDANFAPWYAPAGYSRGVVTGVNDIAISPTQSQRDQLYKIAINPITQFPSDGIIVFGQKTLQRKPTAFDRINVRRLFLDLEKRTKETIKYFIFEPNTFLTRTKVVDTLTPIFENAKQTQGVYDYLIVCDERNNTSARIENNELIVDIYIKPVRAAEFILVNFYAVNNDVNFEELIGQ